MKKLKDVIILLSMLVFILQISGCNDSNKSSGKDKQNGQAQQQLEP